MMLLQIMLIITITTATFTSVWAILEIVDYREYARKNGVLKSYIELRIKKNNVDYKKADSETERDMIAGETRAYMDVLNRMK